MYGHLILPDFYYYSAKENEKTILKILKKIWTSEIFECENFENLTNIEHFWHFSRRSTFFFSWWIILIFFRKLNFLFSSRKIFLVEISMKFDSDHFSCWNDDCNFVILDIRSVLISSVFLHIMYFCNIFKNLYLWILNIFPKSYVFAWRILLHNSGLNILKSQFSKSFLVVSRPKGHTHTSYKNIIIMRLQCFSLWCDFQELFFLSLFFFLLREKIVKLGVPSRSIFCTRGGRIFF